MAQDNQSISRRDMLLLAGAAAAGALASPTGAHAAPEAAGTIRQEIPINDGWRFIRRDVKGAQQPKFDDSRWKKVSLPHTYNGIDGEKHGHYYRGPTWYRLNLKLPPAAHAAGGAAPKNYFLYFEGAATVADVYLNGRHVGNHRGAFAGFCIDVTKAINPGGENLLAVRVNNAWNKNIPPLAGDFNIFGGLYRTAHLLIVNPVSISPLDYGSSGAYILQENVSADSARLKLTAILRNATSHAANVSVAWRARDHRGRTVVGTSHRAHVPAGQQIEAVAGMIMHRPHLWHGRNDPYLYSMEVTLRQGRKIIDRVTQPLGLRFFHIDPDNGFHLNGEAYPLHGVCTHDDRPGVGRAVPRADYLQDCAMIHALGARSVRMAHYQHDQTMYDACDRNGLVVWTEDGLVNHIEEDAGFNQNARQQFLELVKQNYNHPCVFAWSLFNELAFNVPPKSQLNLDFPATPVLSSEYRFTHPPASEFKLPWAILYDLNQLAHDLDPSRLTVAASDQSPHHPINYITDIISFNRYDGWYGGTPGEWPGTLDELKRVVRHRMPGRILGISEYGAGANAFQHEDYPVKQPPPGGQWHPEEWQCIVHEAAYKAMKQRPWLWNTTLWVMFNFSSEGRNEGADPGRNDKGLVTYDRKIKKDAYFFYLAQWTTEPFAYICDRRFTPRPAGTVLMKAYSNCPKVELFINGNSQGVQKPDDHVFVWPHVKLAPGDVEVSAVGTDAQGGKHHDHYVVHVKAAG